MSSSDLLSKFDDLVKRLTHEFTQIIQSERAKLKAELDEYNAATMNAEKQKMKAIDVSDDDIISLNVGGQKFTTTRSTLCQVEGSLLSTMFSGRREDGLKRDQDGAVFFDFNPQYVGYILEYLRTKKIATPEKPAKLPKVSPDDWQNFTTLVEYLGLAEEIVVSADDATNDVANEKFNLHGPEITLQEDGKMAVKSSKRGHEYVVGENVYQQGIVHLKLKLESFENNGWLLVGIVKQDAVQQNNSYSHTWPGSYGWALGSRGEVWKSGSNTTNYSFKNLTKQGDIVELILNCDAAKLSLHLPTGHQFHIDLPQSQAWRLHVNMPRPNDKVCIIGE